MATTTDNTNRIHDLRSAMDKLAQVRDEQRLKLHLAKADALDEWAKVEKRWEKLQGRFKRLQDTAEEAGDDVWTGVELLVDDVKEGYEKVRKSL